MIGRYTSPNENFEYDYPHSNAILQSRFKLECFKPHKAARQITKCDVINDVKLFPTVYCRLYRSKFLALSNKHYVTNASALEYLVALFKTYSIDNLDGLVQIINGKISILKFSRVNSLHTG